MRFCWITTLLRPLLVTALLAGSVITASADEWRTTSSLIGQSKYGDDFQHYDYVNPAAPKGGTLNTVVSGAFDSFNPYIIQGAAGAGFAAFGGGLLYDTLMEQATDEGGTRQTGRGAEKISSVCTHGRGLYANATSAPT